jgi:hypothetical protein
VFYDNKLTSISIPATVTSIGEKAFEFNRFKTITIAGTPVIGEDAFETTFHTIRDREVYLRNGFLDYYESRGRKPGTYTYKRNISENDLEIVGVEWWSFSASVK